MAYRHVGQERQRLPSSSSDLPVGDDERGPVEVEAGPIAAALVGVQVHAAALGRRTHLQTGREREVSDGVGGSNGEGL